MLQALGVKFGTLEVKYDKYETARALGARFRARRTKLSALESKFVADRAKL